MSRRRVRMIITLVVLVLLLAAVGVLSYNYYKSKTLGFNISFNAADTLVAPKYMYSFSGSATNRLQRPIGVVRADGKVYVTDAVGSQIFVFTPTGDLIKTFGKEQLETPLYIAQNPKNGNLYVSDRRKREILMYDTDGKYLGVFDPKLPKDQLPKIKTDKKWAPVAIAFADDGTMYVSEILRGHRLLVFGPDGAFKKSTGDAALVTKASEGGGLFQFPNSIKVHGDEVWVSDSNNRRVQIFDKTGEFKRIVVTDGLPRGLAFLPRMAGMSSETPDRFVVVDTLAHDATILDTTGERLVTFGGQGVLEGQFSYPNDTATDDRSRIFVTDTSNARVQVWGWPEAAAPIPTPTTPQQWGYLFLPLLLLPLLLLGRKKSFFATPDFLEQVLENRFASQLPARRRRWIVEPHVYEQYKDVVQDEVKFGEILNAVEHSPSDAQAIIDRFEVDEATAATIATAQRARYVCTESADLRRIGKVLDLDVMDTNQFMERFGRAPKDAVPSTE